MLRRAGIELPEPRQNFKPQVVPCGGVRVRVRVVFDMRDVVSARIGDELFSRLLQKRADDVTLPGPHAAKTAQICPADEVQEHCFRIVI